MGVKVNIKCCGVVGSDRAFADAVVGDALRVMMRRPGDVALRVGAFAGARSADERTDEDQAGQEHREGAAQEHRFRLRLEE